MTRKTVKSGMIAPDDLRKGAFVVIHSGRPVVHQPASDFDMMFRSEPVPSMPMPPMGLALKVLGVNLPYVLVTPVNPGNATSGLMVVDVRLANLMHVNKSFVDAVVGFTPPPEANKDAGGTSAASGPHAITSIS